MKHRVLVMNGQRIVQHESGAGEWVTEHVEKAGALRPAIYNLYNAGTPEPSHQYQGAIIHADKSHVYQQVGKSFIRHDAASFDKVPDIGTIKTIMFENGRSTVSDAQTQTRKLTR